MEDGEPVDVDEVGGRRFDVGAVSARLTVVIATYDRVGLLLSLLADLEGQDLPVPFEAVVVDDGGSDPVPPSVEQAQRAFPVRLLRRSNGGPSVARDQGVRLATGELVVILDDDMAVGPGFLRAHWDAHRRGADVVLGRIDQPAATGSSRPLFERFHQRGLDQLRREAASAGGVVRGWRLCTGNVSFRRSDYLQVGGFDPALIRCEDRDLGVRFELAGLRLSCCDEARSVHRSDHEDVAVWRRRSRLYGASDKIIHDKHPKVPRVSPWAFLEVLPPVVRPVLVLGALAPGPSSTLGSLAYRVAQGLDALGSERLALTCTGLCYGLDYFGGAGRAHGGALPAWRSLRRYRADGEPGATRRFARSVRADHQLLRRMQSHYHGEDDAAGGLAADAVQRIGFQMMVAIRAMRLARDSGLAPLAKVASRLIRLVYGAEIHWDADFDDGVCIVHGNGLVVSHSARIGTGCILFHGVTLGESRDAGGRVGGPRLGQNVHVGPGAVLLGPIEIGSGSKVMANTVVSSSIPPASVVMASPPEVVPRRPVVGPSAPASTRA